MCDLSSRTQSAGVLRLLTRALVLIRDSIMPSIASVTGSQYKDLRLKRDPENVTHRALSHYRRHPILFFQWFIEDGLIPY